MKRAKFIRQCLKRSGGTEKQLLEFHDIVRCECGKKSCPGWRARYMLRNERRRVGA